MENQKYRLTAWLLHLLGVRLSYGEESTSFNDTVLVPKPRHHKLSYAGIAVGSLVVLIAGWMVSGIYLTHLQIGKVSAKTHVSNAVLASLLTHEAASYRATVHYPGAPEQRFGLTDMGLFLDTQASVRAVRSAEGAPLHRIMWWKPLDAPLKLKVNNAALNSFITKNITLIAQPSKDASLSIINGEVKVSDASAGKEYGLMQPQQALKNAASTLSLAPIKLHVLTLNPAVTAEALNTSKVQLESLLNQKVSFAIADKIVTPSPNDIAQWLELTPDEKDKKVDITVNSGKVAEYINKITAPYVRPPRDQVEVAQADGSTSILVNGVNGSDVADKAKVSANIAQHVLEAKGIQIALPVTHASYKTITAQSYPKWIEVDLANKRMYAYEETTLVKTFSVTAGAPATPTVTGQYAIYSKRAQQDMRGNNVDGSRYFQPHVPWVNYFYKDYAIHGNYWRPLSYFGNINSSHGCVSVVPSEAQWMYDWAPIGTPVIVHS